MRRTDTDIFFSKLLIGTHVSWKIGNCAEMSGAETTRRRVVQRRIGGAEMALPH